MAFCPYPTQRGPLAMREVQTELNRYQDMLAEEYTRWKRVNCRFCYGLDGVFWLNIGEGGSCFTFIKVLGEY